MKKIYQVTVTYLNTIEAESCEDAENRTEEMIRNGDLVPNDFETEEVPGEVVKNIIYVYFDEEFDNYEDILNHLIDLEEIKNFNDWINDSFDASTIYFNKYVNLEPSYKEYQEDMLKWLIQIGRVRVTEK